MENHQSTSEGKSAARGGSVLLIDNYDSFVFNLDHYLRHAGLSPIVHRNDRVSLKEVESLRPAGIVISPGPGWPARAGISVELIRRFAKTTPILGVCLGHQAIAEAFGGTVRRSGAPVHGKTSVVVHDGQSLFSGLTSPFTAMRYHSLIVDEATLPDCLHVSARTSDDIIMGLRHRVLPVEGVQFHPESILTELGQRLVANFAARLVPGVN